MFPYIEQIREYIGRRQCVPVFSSYTTKYSPNTDSVKSQVLDCLCSVQLRFRNEILFYRSSLPEVISGKSVREICSKFTGEHPCRTVIPKKLLCRFIEITLRMGVLQLFAAYFQNTFS